MADCTYWSFDPDSDPTYKKTFTDWLIQRKSHLTHSEKQYSHRYGGISCSTTLADEGKCWRFKPIDYTKHPLRWKGITIPCTDEQEDMMWEYDRAMADINQYWLRGGFDGPAWKHGPYFGPNALKYDKWGVIFCNISHRRILGSSDKRAWCTESRIMTLLQAFPDLTTEHPDTYRPDNGHKLIEGYFSPANTREGR